MAAKTVDNCLEKWCLDACCARDVEISIWFRERRKKKKGKKKKALSIINLETRTGHVIRYFLRRDEKVGSRGILWSRLWRLFETQYAFRDLRGIFFSLSLSLLCLFIKEKYIFPLIFNWHVNLYFEVIEKKVLSRDTDNEWNEFSFFFVLDWWFLYKFFNNFWIYYVLFYIVVAYRFFYELLIS